MTTSNGYASHEEASLVAGALRDFGIVSRTELVETFGGDEREAWWEVRIIELPAGLVAEARVVEDRPATTSPSRTELDENDIGASTWWDREWEREHHGE
jgi:hypothetical protein